MLFRNLTESEIAAFKQWARDNYEKYSPIDGLWHPIVQAECVAINSENGFSGARKTVKI